MKGKCVWVQCSLTVVEAVASLVPAGLKSSAARELSCALIPATALYRNKEYTLSMSDTLILKN